MSSSFSNWLSQLASSAPFLLVCLAGAVVALIFWKRCTLASAMVLGGVAVMALARILSGFGTAWILEAPEARGWDHEQMQSALATFSLAAGLFHAAGVATLIGAAFVGRSARRSA